MALFFPSCRGRQRAATDCKQFRSRNLDARLL